jgi:hypothetical protein
VINHLKHIGFLLVLLALGVTLAGAQGTSTITYPKPFDVRALRGKVVIANTRDPLESVLVEECTSDGKTVVQSGRTNNTGHFDLRSSLVKGEHYLRFSMPGMNTVMIRVHVLRLSPKSEISIEMPVAN